MYVCIELMSQQTSSAADIIESHKYADNIDAPVIHIRQAKENIK